MVFRRKRRSKKRSRSLAEIAADQNAKRAAKERTMTKAFNEFGQAEPDVRKAIERIKSKAVSGYQRPPADYDINDHLADMLNLLRDLGLRKAKVLGALAEVTGTKRRANKINALVQLSSADDTGRKVISKYAAVLKEALDAEVVPDELEAFRLKKRPRPLGRLGRSP